PDELNPVRSDEGFTEEEEAELTTHITQLVRKAERSRTSDKLTINIEYRNNNYVILLNVPPSIAAFNKELKKLFGRALSISVHNSKANLPFSVDSDASLHKVLDVFSQKNKTPSFNLADKNILEPSPVHVNWFHHPCLPGPSKPTTIYLPQIVRSLGEGSTAKVYLIRDAKTGALFAMKKLSNAEGKSAAREMEAFTTIKSRRLVSLVTAFHEEDYTKFIMEYLPGGSLDHVIKEGNKAHEFPPLSWDLISKYTREILEGMDDIHNAGYIHMDIKPLNLLLEIDGSLKITDFGSFAKIGTKSSFLGTHSYASPEAIANNTSWDSSTDIWSVGVTLLEMILGRVPWATNRREEMPLQVFCMMEKTILEELSELSLPAPLNEILERTLVIDPTSRSNATQLLSLFEQENQSSILGKL
ncbi:hypothetical protein PFISCL1PPCAC_19952, partial [Pristionchus fissidentatus]